MSLQRPEGFDLYSISLIEREIRKVRISDSAAINAPYPGVTVVVSELKKNITALRPNNSLQEFSEIFALYLKAYKDTEIRISGELIDPAHAIAAEWRFGLAPIIDESGNSHDVVLDIIEWKNSTKRALYLCSESGFPLSQIEARFHVGDFHFSAYLKSSYNSQLHQDNRLDMAEMVPRLVDSVEEARARIKDVFRQRASARAKTFVEGWKTSNVYPYQGEAANHLEKAERQIFDIVAVTVQEASNEFKDTPPKQLALHLRMLRHAIEHSPSDLQKILDEVLKLPKRKQQELATLLDETDLSGIISAPQSLLLTA